MATPLAFDGRWTSGVFAFRDTGSLFHGEQVPASSTLNRGERSAEAELVSFEIRHHDEAVAHWWKGLTTRPCHSERDEPVTREPHGH